MSGDSLEGGNHLYLVNKGQGCYSTPDNDILKKPEMCRTSPHTKNDPAQNVSVAKGGKHWPMTCLTVTRILDTAFQF